MAVLNRARFVQQLCAAGLDYVNACKAYDTMISAMEDSIVAGDKICLGAIGTIRPVKLKPRVVHMGFDRRGGTVKRVKREYVLGFRIKYRFSLHRSFVTQHNLRWFD